MHFFLRQRQQCLAAGTTEFASYRTVSYLIVVKSTPQSYDSRFNIKASYTQTIRTTELLSSKPCSIADRISCHKASETIKACPLLSAYSIRIPSLSRIKRGLRRGTRLRISIICFSMKVKCSLILSSIHHFYKKSWIIIILAQLLYKLIITYIVNHIYFNYQINT